jgi:hypothetical protein
MPYEIRQEKSYDSPAQSVYAAALKAVAGLEGKLLQQSPEKGELEAKFDKKILGQVLGDRTQMTAHVTAAESSCSIAVEAFPIDAVGRKLMFGARQGVTQTVVTWFFAHLEHHLGKD